MFRSDEESEDEGIVVSSRLFWFLILGFVLVFTGIMLLVAASLFSGGSGSVGVVIFIGPIPIVFGAGPDANWLILLGIVLAVFSIMLFLIMKRKVQRIVG